MKKIIIYLIQLFRFVYLFSFLLLFTACNHGDSNSHIHSSDQVTNPAPPNSIQVISPSQSPGFETRPILRITGVKNNYEVKVFSDSQCQNQVASGFSLSETIDVQTSTLSMGTTYFYAQSVDPNQLESICSAALSNYTRSLCPNGYVQILANNTVGVSSNFCVMKFEAKCASNKEGTTNCDNPSGPGASNKVAVSLASGLPWISITASDALQACQNLNSDFGFVDKFDLISNAEWMAIAREIEAQTTNWTTDGGILKLSRGHSDMTPSGPCDGVISNVQNCATMDTNISKFDQKRTFNLSSGEDIWDISGNVSEWVDWTKENPDNDFTLGPQSCNYGGYVEIQELISSCNPDLGDPSGSALASPSNTSLTFIHNIGRAQGSGGGGGATVRGGSYNLGSSTGVYSLNLLNSDTVNSYVGFRCVYRP